MGWLLIFLAIVVIWLIIYPGTDYWQRWFSPLVVKKGKLGRNGQGKELKICLTFDDGPNPEITPQILAVLARYHIPATFFLVGKRAESSPDLVRDILGQGHEIGAHTYYHSHAYRMFFKKSINTVIYGKRILEEITGKPVVWFRPPWGALNIFELFTLKQLKLKIVLWSANAVDWDIHTTPAQIVERLTHKLSPGCIIVIHDAGGDQGAPLHTLQALPEFIKQAQVLGYSFETLTNITGEFNE